MAETLPAAVQLTKALAHPSRLRIIALLRQGPLPVCQITSVLRSVASTVSGHLNDLRHSGIVTEHRQGKFVYYCLSERPSTVAVLDAILSTLAEDSQLRQDAAVARSVRAISPSTVCEPSPRVPDDAVATGGQGRAGGPRS